jgi:acyl-coenzyme A synthetase/AMP-(fatty) acid ligase
MFFFTQTTILNNLISESKGVVRSTGGYMVSLKDSMKTIYGVNPGETWWAFSDLGWTVGHSYGCYGPLSARNTSVLYEGKPVGTPNTGAVFRVLSEHKVVSCFLGKLKSLRSFFFIVTSSFIHHFKAPTAIRAIIQQDPDALQPKKYPLNHLRHMFVAGEHCDHETMQWIKNLIKKPVFDHWWQTETGWPITSMCAGLMSPNELQNVPDGVSGKPVPGYDGLKLNKISNYTTGDVFLF